MSGRIEREDSFEEIIIDQASRVPGSRRKGNKNPTSEEIERATQAFIRNGGIINRHIPEWETSLEAFVNLPVDTMSGADVWLLS